MPRAAAAVASPAAVSTGMELITTNTAPGRMPEMTPSSPASTASQTGPELSHADHDVGSDGGLDSAASDDDALLSEGRGLFHCPVPRRDSEAGIR
ncbi:hypothetical protein QO002_001198 [Pararhizobium capsulatum DSM 1112]|uniref:Secreted protein n=1 Tax=Pararhizobium capsulatum DSM 1112 TaxID=1121113 RepID=A0ABU0BLE3_9HYPH|nr:hypothetical protein [Pararhizobium capsulatum DSM 1112]